LTRERVLLLLLLLLLLDGEGVVLW